MRRTLNPAELSVLSIMGRRMWTIGDVQDALYRWHSPAEIHAAISTLHHARYVRVLPGANSLPLYEMTAAGLAADVQQRREQANRPLVTVGGGRS